jgi:hypothetical protein
MAKKKTEKHFEVSPELRKLAEKVIADERLDVYPAKIEYVLEYPNITKSVAGRCIKAGKELNFFGQFDYLIKMSGELWDQLDEQRQYILMLHELKHVLVTQNDETGDWVYKLRDHDVKDFQSILSKYGADWISDIKTIAASIYDMTTAEQDNFKI